MNKYDKARCLAEDLAMNLVHTRRMLHAHPELGWSEYITTNLIVEKLDALGYDVSMGEDVTSLLRMGLPAHRKAATTSSKA